MSEESEKIVLLTETDRKSKRDKSYGACDSRPTVVPIIINGSNDLDRIQKILIAIRSEEDTRQNLANKRTGKLLDIININKNNPSGLNRISQELIRSHPFGITLEHTNIKQLQKAIQSHTSDSYSRSSSSSTSMIVNSGSPIHYKEHSSYQIDSQLPQTNNQNNQQKDQETLQGSLLSNGTL